MGGEAGGGGGSVFRALQISVVLEDALGGDSRGASGMIIIIRCRGRCQMAIMQLAAYALIFYRDILMSSQKCLKCEERFQPPLPTPKRKKECNFLKK